MSGVFQLVATRVLGLLGDRNLKRCLGDDVIVELGVVPLLQGDHGVHPLAAKHLSLHDAAQHLSRLLILVIQALIVVVQQVVVLNVLSDALAHLDDPGLRASLVQLVPYVPKVLVDALVIFLISLGSLLC